jgi:8-hydroxy-5-deazaflavin:NADPH oxidoreductase
MRITIVGAGNMGMAFAGRLTASGHDVVLTSRNPDSARKKAKEISGRIRVEEAGKAAAGAELVIAATPFPEQINALKSLGNLGAVPVVEICNPLKPDMSGMALGFTTSAVEEISKALPGLRIVKAFNTISAQLLGEAPKAATGARLQVLFAGNDEGAKRTVSAMVESMGFEPLDAGPLQNARNLEPMGMQNIWFMYVAKQGARIAPGWLRA